MVGCRFKTDGMILPLGGYTDNQPSRPSPLPSHGLPTFNHGLGSVAGRWTLLFLPVTTLLTAREEGMCQAD